MAEMTFKVVVMAPLVVKITFVVTEIIFMSGYMIVSDLCRGLDNY